MNAETHSQLANFIWSRDQGDRLEKGVRATRQHCIVPIIADVETATWMSPHHMRERYPSASFLGGGVTVFNVKGNSYRLEATVAYKTGTVVVLWLGTHGEYDARNRRR